MAHAPASGVRGARDARATHTPQVRGGRRSLEPAAPY